MDCIAGILRGLGRLGSTVCGYVLMFGVPTAVGVPTAAPSLYVNVRNLMYVDALCIVGNHDGCGR